MSLELLSEADQNVLQSVQDVFVNMRDRYDEVHDDQHTEGQLNQAAASLSQYAEGFRRGNAEMKQYGAHIWPFAPATPFPVFSTVEEYLNNAAAFILCEASRIRRQSIYRAQK